MGQRSDTQHTTIMKFAIVLLIAAVAYARPQSLEEGSAELTHSEVSHPDDDGAHSMRFAVDNGIDFQLSGQEAEDGGAEMVGSYTYIVDGEAVPLTSSSPDKKLKMAVQKWLALTHTLSMVKLFL